MYNLLKIGSMNEDEWAQNQANPYDISFLNDRIFEYTDKEIELRFTNDDGGPDFDALMKLPCLFTYEGKNVIGSIGWLTRARPVNGGLSITYNLPNIYPKIALDEESVFQALGMGHDRSFERHRTHWAVKDVDLFETVTRLLHDASDDEEMLSKEDMIRVWGGNSENKKKIFLSHRAKYKGRVAEVRETLEGRGFSCFLAHEDVTPSKIWQNEILNALNTMDIFIGFVTDDFHKGGWPDQEIGYACHRRTHRVFVKLGGADPVGMVGREQALTSNWDRAGSDIVEHLKGEGIA